MGLQYEAWICHQFASAFYNKLTTPEQMRRWCISYMI